MNLRSHRNEAGAPPPALDPWLWVALCAGATLRGWLLWLYSDLWGFGDETLHYVKGMLVSQYGTGLLGHWAPGYEVFLGALLPLSAPDPWAAKAVQVVLSVVTIGLVYGIARNAGGCRAGRVAAVLCALHPSLAAYSHYLYAETLYIALLCAAIWVLHRGGERSRRSELVAGGVLFGLAGLTRSVVLYFLPLWILWELVRGRRRRAAEAAIVLGCALVVVLPWTLRNLEKYDGFVLVDGTFGPTAWLATKELLFNQDLGFNDDRGGGGSPTCPNPRIAGPDPLPPIEEMIPPFLPPHPAVRDDLTFLVKKLRAAKEKATRDVVARQRCEFWEYLDFATSRPERLAWLAGWRFYSFWGPNSFLLRGIAIGQYPQHGPLARPWYPLWREVLVLSHILLGVAAILAFGRRRSPPVEWFAIFIGYYTVVHMFAVAYSRYRLPVMPLVIVLAALWLARPELPERGRRGALIYSLAAGFVGVCIWYVVARLP